MKISLLTSKQGCDVFLTECSYLFYQLAAVKWLPVVNNPSLCCLHTDAVLYVLSALLKAPFAGEKYNEVIENQ